MARGSKGKAPTKPRIQGAHTWTEQSANNSAFWSSSLSVLKDGFLAVAHLAADVSRLRVWNTTAGHLLGECSFPHSKAVTSLAWVDVRDGGSVKPSKGSKKQAVADSQKAVQHALIFIGREDGSIAIFSTAQNAVTSEYPCFSARKVSDVATDAQGKRIYACADDGIVSELDSLTGKELRKLQTDIKNLKRVSVNSKGTRMLTAGRTIKLWNLENLDLLQTYSGHTDDVKLLQFFADDSMFLSTADFDRYINIYDASNVESNSPVYSLVSSSTPLNVDIHGTELLCVVEEGTVQVWSGIKKPGRTAGTGVSKEPLVTFQIMSGSEEDEKPKENSERQTIQAAAFTPGVGKALDIRVARNITVKPAFDLLKYRQSASASASGLVSIIRKPIEGVLAVVEDQMQEKMKPRAYKEATSNVILPASGLPSLAKPADYQPRSNTGGLSFEEQLKALEVKKEGTTSGTTATAAKQPELYAKDGSLRASSLAVMLSQAIKTGDKHLLETCLNVQNTSVLVSTVKRMEPQQCLELLGELVVRINRSPNRARQILPWVKTIITHHAAYMCTVPDLQQKVKGVYELVDYRLKTFKRLLRLSGRLQLLMTQVEARKEAERADAEAAKPILVAMDVDTDEEDEDEGAEEDEDEQDEGKEDEEEQEDDADGEEGEEDEEEDDEDNEDEDQDENGMDVDDDEEDEDED